VVCIDIEITAGRDAEIEPAMAAELIQHVIEEWDTGIDRGDPRPIETELDLNTGL
jgi:hypothetical protein